MGEDMPCPFLAALATVKSGVCEKLSGKTQKGNEVFEVLMYL